MQFLANSFHNFFIILVLSKIGQDVIYKEGFAIATQVQKLA